MKTKEDEGMYEQVPNSGMKRKSMEPYCAYKTGACDNQRAIKVNGEYHTLCEFQYVLII